MSTTSKITWVPPSWLAWIA